jgi:hypothetical protein
MASFDTISNPNYRKYMEKTVDVYIASLPRQLHVVETVKSVLENPETLTITIVANKYSDEQFKEVCHRLAGLNSLYEVPITIYRGDNAKESNEKLRHIGKGEGKYISFVDDDLILSPQHFSLLIQKCEQYNAYVSLHGVALHPLPIKSYYRDRDVYRGLGTVLFDMEVDIASNCGSLFKRDFFPPDMLKEMYEHCENISMDDIYMAYWCKRMGVKRFVIAHREGFMKHKVQYKEDEYVFDRYALPIGADTYQTYFINQYWNK